MTAPPPVTRYRFGVFEVDFTTGELRRKGMKIKLHAQPFQVLVLLLARPGEMLTREEICRELWPTDTFVDYEHGVNSAINRLREALGDKASNPRFIETMARRGYRFVAPVERVVLEAPAQSPPAQSPPEPVFLESPTSLADTAKTGFLDRVLATPEDLPNSPHTIVQTLFVLLQLLYLAFYIGALTNLPEINGIFSPLRFATQTFVLLIITAAILIPVRTFLLCAVIFHAPRMREKYRKLWRFLLPLDCLWALAPFLLLHHISYGLALACTTLLVYSPFAQRSLILMGAGDAYRQPSP